MTLKSTLMLTGLTFLLQSTIYYEANAADRGINKRQATQIQQEENELNKTAGIGRERIRERANPREKRIRERANPREKHIRERANPREKRIRERENPREKRIRERANPRERIRERANPREEGIRSQGARDLRHKIFTKEEVTILDPSNTDFDSYSDFMEYNSYRLAIDPEIMELVTQEDSNFDEKDRTAVFIAYLERSKDDSSFLQKILNVSKSFNINGKASIYNAYAKRSDPNPEIISQMIKGLTKYDKRYHRLYLKYISQPNADPDTLSAIIKNSKSLKEHLQSRVYENYFSGPNTAPNLTEEILIAIKKMSKEYRFDVYSAYVKYPNADPDIIERLINSALEDEDHLHKRKKRGPDDFSFEEIMENQKKANLFIAYIENKFAKTNTIERIIQNSHYFSEGNKFDVYSAYVRYPDADPDTIEEMTEEVYNHSSDYNNKFSFYSSYVKYPNADENMLEKILTSLIHLQHPGTANVYLAYMERDEIDKNLTKQILTSLTRKNIYAMDLYTDYVKRDVYIAYLQRNDIDPEIASQVHEQSKHLNREDYDKVYEAYVKMPEEVFEAIRQEIYPNGVREVRDIIDRYLQGD